MFNYRSQAIQSQWFDYSKTLRLRTWIKRTCKAKICQLSPLYVKTCLAYIFENDDVLKSMTNSVHLGK